MIIEMEARGTFLITIPDENLDQVTAAVAMMLSAHPVDKKYLGNEYVYVASTRSYDRAVFARLPDSTELLTQGNYEKRKKALENKGEA